MPVQWNRRKYTKDQFINAWNSSKSISECARKLNLTIFGATYRQLKLAADECKLTTEHMTGQGWNVGERYRNFNPAKSLDEYLVENSTYTSTSSLKKRLIAEGFLKEICNACGKRHAFNHFTDSIVKIPLQLDHINGINNDNRLDNLRLLCPTCHALTPTFCRKNKQARVA